MPSDEKYIVSLRRHLFRAPHPLITISAFILILFAMAYLIIPNLRMIAYLFLLPFIAAILLDHLTIRYLRIYFPLRRVTMLNLFAFVLSFVQFLIFRFFLNFNFAYYLAFAAMVNPRYVLYRTFLAERKNYAFLVAFYYNIAIFLVSLIENPTFPAIPFAIASGIYMAVGYVFISSTTAPFRKEFREDPLVFISSFLNYLSLYRKEDERKINRFFHSIYSDRTVPITVMVFRSSEKIKGIFVAPYIHPGPFGSIGGSDIPNKLEKLLQMENLMVFHTTTTHDNNVSGDEDVQIIAEAVKSMVDEECTYSNMSDVIRFNVDGISAMAQKFGDYYFIALLPENAEFDDVELATGLAIRKFAMKYGKDAMVIDAHNCFDENALPLSLTRPDIMEIEKVLSKIKSDRPIQVGFGRITLKGESIGPGGIRAAVFKYGERRIGYILIDGNNIKRGLRKRIREKIIARGILDDVEVFSTDNHLVNATMIDLNPIGERDPWENIIESSVKATEIALEDLEEACVHMKTKFVKLRMAPAGTLTAMSKIARAGVRRAKYAVPLLFTAGFLASYLTFLMLG